MSEERCRQREEGGSGPRRKLRKGGEKEGVLKVLMVGGWAEFLTDKSADNRLS